MSLSEPRREPPGEPLPAEVSRWLRSLNPQQLRETLAYLDELEQAVERDFGVKLRFTAEIHQTLPAVTQSATATVVNPAGIGSATVVGEPAATGTATGTTVWTGWAVGAAPPVPTAPAAVASLWDMVKPKSPQDLVLLTA